MKKIRKCSVKGQHIPKSLSALFLIIALCFLASGRHADASAVSKNGQLQVKGRQIVNKKGKPFVIKGVSTHGLSWYPQYVNKKAFQSLKKRGVNTIRLAMYTEEYNGYCVGGAENKKRLEALIHSGVKNASALGMYVIIDWHILSDGNPLTHKKEAKAFFRKMAKKYNGCPNVLFEICNEPNGSGGNWKNIQSYANAVIKTIRSVNKKAIIIVGTPTWSQEVGQAAAAPLKGKNIAYAFHFYAATHRQELRDKLEAAAKGGLPILVTEFGLSEASGNGTVSIKEANQWNTLLNRYQIGRVCWNLSNKDESCSLIKASCRKTGGWKKSDFTKAGKWLFNTY